MTTRHATHPPVVPMVEWWSGLLKGAVAGTSPTGPWTGGGTRTRTSNDNDASPWRILLDRPCLLLTMVKQSITDIYQNPKTTTIIRLRLLIHTRCIEWSKPVRNRASIGAQQSLFSRRRTQRGLSWC